MADVVDRTEARGQLLIIAAISLAILLVLLALALNTAVFGGVHVAATDDGIQEERGAIQYQDGVDRGVSGLLPVVIEDTAGYSEGDVEAAFETEVKNWSNAAGPAYARDRIATNAAVAGATDFGTYIVDNDTSRNFTNADGNASWTVAEDVSTVWDYEMNVSEDRLATEDCAGNGTCFNLSVADSGWKLSVYKNVSGDGDQEIIVDIDADDGVTCRTNSSYAVIDLSRGVLDAPGCANRTFSTFLEDVDGPYTLNYTNADNVNGTYGLVVDKQVTDDSDFADDSPRIEPSVIAADVTVSYQSTDLRYETDIRVTAGDPDDG